MTLLPDIDTLQLLFWLGDGVEYPVADTDVIPLTFDNLSNTKVWVYPEVPSLPLLRF